MSEIGAFLRDRFDEFGEPIDVDELIADLETGRLVAPPPPGPPQWRRRPLVVAAAAAVVALILVGGVSLLANLVDRPSPVIVEPSTTSSTVAVTSTTAPSAPTTVEEAAPTTTQPVAAAEPVQVPFTLALPASGDIQPAIAMTRDGLATIAYVDRNESRLTVVACLDAACTEHTQIVVLEVEDDPGFAEIDEFRAAATADGRLVFTFHMHPGDETKIHVLVCLDRECSSTAGAVLGDGLFPTVAVRADGNPIVSWWDGTANDFEGAMAVASCTDPECTEWVRSDPVPGLPFPWSVAIDGAGLPLIPYAGSEQVRIYDCADAECTTGTSVNTRTTGGLTMEVLHMAVPPDARPVMAYSRFSESSDEQTIYFARCAEPRCDGGAVSVTELATGPEVTFSPALAIGSGDLARVLYHDGPRLFLVTCTDPDCVQASMVTISSESEGSWRNSAIAVGPDDLPIIVYMPDGGNEVTVLACAEHDCSDRTN